MFRLETQIGGKSLCVAERKKFSVFSAKPGGAWRIVITGFQKVKLLHTPQHLFEVTGKKH
jgi:hypothetical protein